MSEPDAQEIRLLSQFRERLKDLKLTEEFNTDPVLIRWIRAREGNLNKAENMLRTSLKWRDENNIDKILDWTYPEILESLSYIEFLGYDNENCPIIWIPFGYWNLRKIVLEGEAENLIKYADRLFVLAVNYTKGKVTSTGYPVSQFVLILDYDQFSFMTMASVAVVQSLLTIARRFEANHPETLKIVYCLNAGRVFQALFALLRPILSERTMAKLEIHGSDERTWKPILAKAIPQKYLLVQYGGCYESKFKTDKK